MKKLALTLISLLCLIAFGNSLPVEKQAQFFVSRPPISDNGGGGGKWALIGSGVAAGSTDGMSVTTTTYNTTGAQAIYIVESAFGSFPPTDPQGNIYEKITNSVGFHGETLSLWECNNPVTDVGQTYSVSSVNSFCSLAVFAFSGGAGDVLNKVNANFNDGSASTVKPGLITPDTANQLIVSGVSFSTGTTAAVDSGLSTPLTVGFAVGQHEGLGAAFLVQDIAATIDLTWDMATGGGSACVSSSQ